MALVAVARAARVIAERARRAGIGAVADAVEVEHIAPPEPDSGPVGRGLQKIAQRRLDQQALSLKADQLAEAVTSAGFVVEDNDIVDSGQTGVVQDHGADEVYSGQRFEANRYRGEVSWTWQDAERDFAAWQGFGFDALGSFEVAR